MNLYLGSSHMLAVAWLGCGWRKDEGHLAPRLLLFAGGEYMAWMGFSALPLNPPLDLGKSCKPSAPHTTNVNMGNQNLNLLGPLFAL